MTDQQTEATKWLELMRNGRAKCLAQFNELVKYIQRELSKDNLTLDDIGTSDAEIGELRVEACKVGASHYLERVRANDNSHGTAFDALLRELDAANLKPEDIGTSDAEIESFKQVA